MGLDNFAIYPVSREPIPNSYFQYPKALCSGICSADENCIRGKVYDDLVVYASGLSLYSDVLYEEDINIIIDSLGTMDFSKFVKTSSNPYQHTQSSVNELKNWFQTVQDHSGIVISWY